MNRVFVGVRRGKYGIRDTHATGGNHAGAGGCDVYVEQNGRRHRLTRRARRIQESYRWDGVGPDSTELARAILWIVTGAEPPWSLYKGFARDIVAHFPAPAGCNGECWRLREEEVLAWLRDAGRLRSEQGEHNKDRIRTAQQEARPRAPLITWQDRIRALPVAFWRRRAA